MYSSIPYISGNNSKLPSLLNRFLPPTPNGVISTWLKNYFPKGKTSVNEHHVLLDPFGSSPAMIIEAAAAGYRVLVSSNNPVTRFLTEYLASPAPGNELKSTLADLAISQKGEERIENHIKNLYESECQQCKEKIMVDAFIWEKGSEAPFLKIYTCPSCGDSGEHPVSDSDIIKAQYFNQNKLHIARALERVAALDDPDRIHAEEALEVYLPRAVYILLTLINLLDRMPKYRRHLTALLLSVLDDANSLWPYPTHRSRPKQLSIPPRFRENNIWLSLEEAVNNLSLLSTNEIIPISFWPELPPEDGGICIFEGRLKDFLEIGDGTKTSIIPEISAIISTLPRPNQAFWSLSTLWTGWLWGREEVETFKSVLRRRRYDWSWHCIALASAFSDLSTLFQNEIPYFTLLGETEPGFISSTLIAGVTANFRLESLSYRSDVELTQLLWKLPKQYPKSDTTTLAEFDLADLLSQSSMDFLKKKNEPVNYIFIHTAGILGILNELDSYTIGRENVQSLFSMINSSLSDAFNYRKGFRRYGGSEHSLDVGFWWINEEFLSTKEKNDHHLSPVINSHSDEIEMMVVKILQKYQGISEIELDGLICDQHRDLFTPASALINACLQSYGELDSNTSLWTIKIQDHPDKRRNDIQEAQSFLVKIGDRFGFIAKINEAERKSGRKSITWHNIDGSINYVFYIIVSGLVSSLLLNLHHRPEKTILVIPGSRSGLIDFKVHSDPRLNQIVSSGCRFVKFRHLRRLYENNAVDIDNFDNFLTLDPLLKHETQIPLF